MKAIGILVVTALILAGCGRPVDKHSELAAHEAATAYQAEGN